MANKINGGWGNAFRKLRPWGSSLEPENQDLCNHERMLVTEFYPAKNLGREAASIERAETWLRKYILQSEEQLADWEAYLSANETAKTNFKTGIRRKQIEKQKVAAAKKTLAKARREILWLILAKILENAGTRLQRFQLKFKAKFRRTQKQRGQPQNMVEGPLRPNLDGFIERAPNKLRPWQGKRNPDSQPVISSNGTLRDGFLSDYKVPNPAVDQLRKDKHFGKHFVGAGRESRLRESELIKKIGGKTHLMTSSVA